MKLLTKSQQLKKEFIQLGTANLVNSASPFFFHEVPVPKQLKNFVLQLKQSNNQIN